MRLINRQFKRSNVDIRRILKHNKQGAGELYWGILCRGIGVKLALQDLGEGRD
jgi:hypothetical protein